MYGWCWCWCLFWCWCSCSCYCICTKIKNSEILSPLEALECTTIWCWTSTKTLKLTSDKLFLSNIALVFTVQTVHVKVRMMINFSGAESSAEGQLWHWICSQNGLSLKRPYLYGWGRKFGWTTDYQVHSMTRVITDHMMNVFFYIFLWGLEF